MAALTGMLVAMGLAWGVFGMPATMIAGSSLPGFVFGFLRIAWIIVASIFLCNIVVETGQFEIMKESIVALSTDLRLQLVLIAFCFGAFLGGYRRRGRLWSRPKRLQWYAVRAPRVPGVLYPCSDQEDF
jgi:lactate permease